MRKRPKGLTGTPIGKAKGGFQGNYTYAEKDRGKCGQCGKKIKAGQFYWAFKNSKDIHYRCTGNLQA